MRQSLTFALVLLLCTISESISSQEHCAACKDVLQGGAFNQHQETFKKDFQSDVEEVFKHNFEYWFSLDEKRAQSLGVSGGFSIFSASVKTAANEQKKREEFNRLQNEYRQSKLQKEYVVSSLSQKTASETLLEAWKFCLKNNCPGNERLTWEIQGGPEEYILTVTYTPKSGSDPEVVEVSSILFVPTSTRQVGGNLTESSQIKKFESASLILKKQTNESAITTTINVSSFGAISIPIGSSTVQKIVNQHDLQGSYNSLPVGTIISSLLDFKTFSFLVGQHINDDDNKMRWAPADGRTLDGSVYSALTFSKNLPDLRGVFLRGLNSFSEREAARKLDRKYDPDNNRTAGQYQSEDVQNHKHGMDLTPVVSFREPGGEWAKNITLSGEENRYFRGKGIATSDIRNTDNVLDVKGDETRPINVAVYYYIKIN